MMIKTATSLAFAAACLATIPTVNAQPAGEILVVAPPPRVDSGDVNWNPQRNVIESKVRSPGGNKPGFSDGPDAQGVRADNRSGTSRGLHQELRHVRAPGRLHSASPARCLLDEVQSSPNPLRRLLDGAATLPKSFRPLSEMTSAPLRRAVRQRRPL